MESFASGDSGFTHVPGCQQQRVDSAEDLGSETSSLFEFSKSRSGFCGSAVADTETFRDVSPTSPRVE